MGFKFDPASLQSFVRSLSFDTICLTFLCSIVLFFLFCRRRVAVDSPPKQKREQQRPDAYNTCDSPLCVRCNDSKSKADARANYERDVPAEPNAPKLKKWYEGKTKAEAGGRQQPTVFFLPDLQTSPFVDPHLYKDDVIVLESEYDVIMEEFVNNALSQIDGWKLSLTLTGRWNVFYFYNQGKKVDRNLARCPRVARFLDQLPSFIRGCSFGNACFSVLMPGSKISEHYGPCNVRVRCHLGLTVVSNNWSLLVDGEQGRWKERKCLLFDDSFLHSVSHERVEDDKNSVIRAVFIVDLWHYNVTANEKSIISNLFPPQ